MVHVKLRKCPGGLMANVFHIHTYDTTCMRIASQEE